MHRTDAMAACAEKMVFCTRTEALAKARQVNHKYRRNNIKPYLCTCGRWHLTSSTVVVAKHEFPVSGCTP